VKREEMGKEGRSSHCRSSQLVVFDEASSKNDELDIMEDEKKIRV
jgi:hypothetical protein